jgi:hypothetical protein
VGSNRQDDVHAQVALVNGRLNEPYKAEVYPNSAVPVVQSRESFGALSMVPQDLPGPVPAAGAEVKLMLDNSLYAT